MSGDTDIHEIARKLVTGIISKMVAEIASEIDAAEGEVRLAVEHVEDLADMLENADTLDIGWREGPELVVYGSPDDDDPDDDDPEFVDYGGPDDDEIERYFEREQELAEKAADLQAAQNEVAERQERVDELAAVRDKVEHAADLDGNGWTEIALEIGCIGRPLPDSHSELAELAAKLADTILKDRSVTAGGSDGLGLRLFDENAPF